MKDLDYVKLLGGRIRALQKHQKMKQLDLAVVIGNHPEHIGRLEIGKLNFIIYTLKKFAKHYKLLKKSFLSFKFQKILAAT